VDSARYEPLSAIPERSAVAKKRKNREKKVRKTSKTIKKTI